MRRLAVAALAVVAIAVVLLARDARPRTRTFVASLADARGLVDGADVRVAGARVGKVTDVALGADGYPRVTARVEAGAAPRRSARVALRLTSLSGERNRYLALDPGTGARVAAIGRDRTRTPVEIDEVLSALGPRTRADVRAAIAGLRGGTDGRGADLAAALRSAPDALGATADALRDVDADGAALRQLVRDARDVTGELAGGRATVGAAVENTAALLRATAARQRDLEATVAALPGALRSADGTLARAQRTMPVLDALVQAAAPGTRRLPGAARTLRATLGAAGPVLVSARRLADRAPAQLVALRPLLRDARPFLSRATPVLRRLGPMLDQARVRLPDFFSFFSNWADFTGNYDANGHAARVGIVFPPGGTREHSPDDTREGQLSKPYLRTPGALEGEPWRDFASSFVGGEG
jgi:phospholipid/cholesterol/gamma-HCH transport system substrate-binding protein